MNKAEKPGAMIPAGQAGLLFLMQVSKVQNHRATGNSRPVCSAQQRPHERLPGLVRTHLSTRWQAPLHGPTVDAFLSAQRLAGRDEMRRQPIFDSGCGNGESTRSLAVVNRGRLVFGIDRSRHRLGRTGHPHFPVREGNIIWVRGDLPSFWRLALAYGWRLGTHYLLYPNPSPKKAQLRRRWHAHPVFPVLLALGGRIEMRTNWEIYAQEFAYACQVATGRPATIERISALNPVSGFERKYRASGHALYRVVTRGRLAALGGMTEAGSVTRS